MDKQIYNRSDPGKKNNRVKGRERERERERESETVGASYS